MTEFQGWATQQEEGRGIRFVDEISKPLLRKFFTYLVDGDEKNDGPENTPYGNVSFSVEKGDILAVGESHLFYVEAPDDALSPISSIMQITETHKDGDQPMQGAVRWAENLD